MMLRPTLKRKPKNKLRIPLDDAHLVLVFGAGCTFGGRIGLYGAGPWRKRGRACKDRGLQEFEHGCKITQRVQVPHYEGI